MSIGTEMGRLTPNTVVHCGSGIDSQNVVPSVKISYWPYHFDDSGARYEPNPTVRSFVSGTAHSPCFSIMAWQGT